LVSFQPKVHLGFDRLYKGAIEKIATDTPSTWASTSACGNNHNQTAKTGISRTQNIIRTNPVGSCCAKGPSYNNN